MSVDILQYGNFRCLVKLFQNDLPPCRMRELCASLVLELTREIKAAVSEGQEKGQEKKGGER